MKSTRARKMIDTALDDLGRQLDAGKSDQLKQYLKTMSKFTRYSVGNCILIACQRPKATHVAGFRAWQKLGRSVRRGEKGIQILAPVVRRSTVVLDDEELSEDRILAFRPAYVFDVSQTEGKPLPEPARVTGDPTEYLDRLKGFAVKEGIELRYSERLGHAEGMSSGGTIVLSSLLDRASECSVLIHEISHELMHQRSDIAESRTVRETEAEAISFVVCEAIGLETHTSSSDYLLHHGATRQTLMQSLQRIRRVANRIIDAIKDDNISTKANEPCEPHALAA